MVQYHHGGIQSRGIRRRFLGRPQAPRPDGKAPGALPRRPLPPAEPASAPRHRSLDWTSASRRTASALRIGAAASPGRPSRESPGNPPGCQRSQTPLPFRVSCCFLSRGVQHSGGRWGRLWVFRINSPTRAHKNSLCKVASIVPIVPEVSISSQFLCKCARVQRRFQLGNPPPGAARPVSCR